jgi:nucleolar GTP-binding protein
MADVGKFAGIPRIPTAEEVVDGVDGEIKAAAEELQQEGEPTPEVNAGQLHAEKVERAWRGFSSRLSRVLDGFPELDDLHPFYGDLFNVLFDRDHFAVARGHIAAANAGVSTAGRDCSARLLEAGGTLEHCKALEREAFEKMCETVKESGNALAYLEEVRQHLGRLPNLDPRARTLILTGFPNVGKSSFMNKISRADVEVQPFSFTTKSLFVGQTDYRYIRFQCIDTPGLLDHPLEERNALEMQAIAAIAHLPAVIIFIFDISEECGYSVADQISLLDSIRPLFANKAVVVVLNKTDARPFSELSEDDQRLINEAVERVGAPEIVRCVHTSMLSDEGVEETKSTACDLLLAQRVRAQLEGPNVKSALKS